MFKDIKNGFDKLFENLNIKSNLKEDLRLWGDEETQTQTSLSAAAEQLKNILKNNNITYTKIEFDPFDYHYNIIIRDVKNDMNEVVQLIEDEFPGSIEVDGDDIWIDTTEEYEDEDGDIQYRATTQFLEQKSIGEEPMDENLKEDLSDSNKIRKALELPLKAEELTEETHASKAKPEGDRITSYKKALELANKNNKPVIYGYTNKRLGAKFFEVEPIICDDLDKCSRDFRNKYKNTSTIYTAYPKEEKLALDESLMEEANVIIDPDNFNSPEDISLKDIAKKEYDQEQSEIKLNKQKEEAQAKIKEIEDQIQAGEDEFEAYFNVLVPASGNADTLAGEMIRAIAKIRYRDYNDGDVFYEGYGLETCGGPAAFLVDVLPDDIVYLFYDIADKVLYDEQYTQAIEDIKDKIIDNIKANPNTLATPNNEDMYDYAWDEENNSPKYDIEVVLSDTVWEMLNDNLIDSSDIVDYLENGVLSYDSQFDGYEIEDWGNTISLSNLTRNAFDQFEEYNKNINSQHQSIWNDFVDQVREDNPEWFDEDGNYMGEPDEYDYNDDEE